MTTPLALLAPRHKTDAALGKGRCAAILAKDKNEYKICDDPAYGPQTESGKPLYRVDIPSDFLVCHNHGGPTLHQAIAGRIAIRFDGPPGPHGGRFIEVERDGASVGLGDWVESGDCWLLVLPGDKK